jgi:alpha-mannosidase
VLNRAALIVRYRQPFVDWINGADPAPGSHTVTLAEVNEEHTVYLVEVEDDDALGRWLAANHRTLFEHELNGWYTDEALRPQESSQTESSVRKRGSYLSVDPETVIVAAVKRAEDDSGVVLRAWESAGLATDAHIELPLLARRWNVAVSLP